MYSIKVVANRFNINPNKLRFYEKKGLIKPKRNIDNGYRTYTDEDLMAIQVIVTYRALDISLDQIKGLLEKKSDMTLVDQLFQQLEIVNGLVHKYRKIQEGLEEIMNDYLLDSSEDQLKGAFMTLGTAISQDDQLNSQWMDLWEFDQQASTYDDLVGKQVDQPIFYKNYEVLLSRVYDLTIDDLRYQGKILDIGVGTGN
jgi:putative AdoMet-dependent methyltransferase